MCAPRLSRLRCGSGLAQLPLLLIFAVATSVDPWACGEDGKMVSDPEIECDPSVSGEYGWMLFASIPLALVGRLGDVFVVVGVGDEVCVCGGHCVVRGEIAPRVVQL